MSWFNLVFKKVFKLLLYWSRSTTVRSGTTQRFVVVACVASVSVRFRSKERGARVKDRAKNGRRGCGRKEGLLPSLPPLSFFGSRLISSAIKTENPLPRSLFARKPNGSACYADYVVVNLIFQLDIALRIHWPVSHDRMVGLAVDPFEIIRWQVNSFQLIAGSSPSGFLCHGHKVIVCWSDL